jgi:hypothetical protein
MNLREMCPQVYLKWLMKCQRMCLIRGSGVETIGIMNGSLTKTEVLPCGPTPSLRASHYWHVSEETWVS